MPAPTTRALPLATGLPAENEQPLLQRLRTAESAGLGDPRERVLGIEAAPDQPAADNDTGSSAAGPAVHVHEPSGVQLGIDRVQRRDEVVRGGHREVADRHPNMAGRRNESGVRLELAFLREIDEERDPRLEQPRDLVRRILRAPGTRVAAGDEAVGDDDGGTAHWSATLSLPGRRYPVRGDRLNRPVAGADSSGMERPGLPTQAQRDRALALSAELGIEPSSWYLRVLEVGRAEGVEPDLGALIRTYWELQQVTGRADLRDEWRRLADAFWQGDAA